jgi:hypothetical protein
MLMEIIPNSNSQAAQESFVLNQLKEKRNGYYVEIGGYHATKDSNTYLLETEYNWSGVSLEIIQNRADLYNESRRNPCLAVDATTYDLLPYFIKNKWPKQIDYLQVDIEPAQQSLKALLNMPMNYRYSVITFEHDRYVGGDNDKYQAEAYDFLLSHGYKIVAHNVSNFEDWYVDPRVIDCSFLGSDIEPHTLFRFVK